jgi:hypothetical protein
MSEDSEIDNKILDKWEDIMAEVFFDWERHARPHFGKIPDSSKSEMMSGNFISIYKTTFYQNGWIERKGSWYPWDSKAFWTALTELVQLMTTRTLYNIETTVEVRHLDRDRKESGGFVHLEVPAYLKDRLVRVTLEELP